MTTLQIAFAVVLGLFLFQFLSRLLGVVEMVGAMFVDVGRSCTDRLRPHHRALAWMFNALLVMTFASLGGIAIGLVAYAIGR